MDLLAQLALASALVIGGAGIMSLVLWAISRVLNPDYAHEGCFLVWALFLFLTALFIARLALGS